MSKRKLYLTSKDGFWRWIIEKILHKKWLRNPTYAMSYYSSLSEEERKKLRERWLKEAKDYIEELKRRGEIY